MPLELLNSKKILEFGPGGGWNAVATSSSGLESYEIVELSRASIRGVQDKFRKKVIKTQKLVVHETDFLTFKSNKKFDLVIAENCLPGQSNPKASLSHISSFVNLDSFLVVTTTSYISVFSELLRGIYAKICRPLYKTENSWIEDLIIYFDPHLKSLNTETRTTSDWVLDNIVNPWHMNKSIFSVKDATKILNNFEIIGSSPQLFLDLQWHKKYLRNEYRIKNKEFIRQYRKNEILLFDKRFSIQKFENSRIDTAFLYSKIEEVSRQCLKIIRNEQFKSNELIIYKLKELNVILKKYKLMEPYEAIQEVIINISKFNKKKLLEWRNVDFRGFWGRGQQYLSFKKVL